MSKYTKFSKKTLSSKVRNRAIDWLKAPDVGKRVGFLAKQIGFSSVNKKRIFCFRSTQAKTRAIARIWGLSRIWQIALKEEPAYIIEVISEKFDRLNQNEKDKVLLHELNHIPNNFSGSLIPHIRRGKRSFSTRLNNKIQVFLAKQKR